MDTIFMTSENSKTTEPHRPLINLVNKIDLKKMINMLLYQIVVCTTHGKI